MTIEEFLKDMILFQSISDINMASIAKSCHSQEVIIDIISKHACNFLYDVLLGRRQSLIRRVGNKANRVETVELRSVLEDSFDLLVY